MDLSSKAGCTVRHIPDPLGYDVDIAHFETVARRMADDALSGINEAAVEVELDQVRDKFGNPLR